MSKSPPGRTSGNSCKSVHAEAVMPTDFRERETRTWECMRRGKAVSCVNWEHGNAFRCFDSLGKLDKAKIFDVP